MKHLPIIIFILLITNYSLLITPALGQERVFDFSRAYNDYIYTYSQYRLAHTDYVTARQAYLNYKTLTSKNEALNKTSQMLKLRDEVIRTYLTALRMRLAETTGVSNYEQNILYLKLDDEVSWFSNHPEILASAGSLEDLVASAQETQSRYNKTEVLIYQTLGTILAGRESALREEVNQQIKALKEKLAEIRQRGDKDTAVLERWLLEAENRLARSQEKQSASQQILAKARPGDRNTANIYSQAQYNLEESHQYLKEAHSYLKELIREVKRAD